MREVNVISYGKGSAEIVVKHKLNDGKLVSITKHVHHTGGGVYEDIDKRKYVL